MPLGGHFKLNKRSCPSTEEENKKMDVIPYSSAVGCLIVYAVGVVSRFLENPGKEHWEAVK